MFPQLPAAVRVFLCTWPTDMRKSFDGLTGLVQESFGQDPLTGHLFLFLNRRRDRIKVLFWDQDGLVIYYERLEAGTFQRERPVRAGVVPHPSGIDRLESRLQPVFFRLKVVRQFEPTVALILSRLARPVPKGPSS